MRKMILQITWVAICLEIFSLRTEALQLQAPLLGRHRLCRRRVSFTSSSSYQPSSHRRLLGPRTVACSASACSSGEKSAKQYKHALAILSMPYTSTDRIANEAILNQVLPVTNKISIFLRCEGPVPSLASLRRYMGEIYSQLWDCVMDAQDPDFSDVVVYVQNLPNGAPESWVNIQPDLDCVCSHDSIIGWTTDVATGRGKQFQSGMGNGVGGLEEHVQALNSERSERNLEKVAALHVDPWPRGACRSAISDDHVLFLDDEISDEDAGGGGQSFPSSSRDGEPENGQLLGGAKIASQQLFESVAVGGTFDGLHFGHRKLLTLAMSCVTPLSGKLLVGVTVDEMLQKKAYAEFIPNVQERIEGVKRFLHRLAPGTMNRVKVVPIADAFGPTGSADQYFDALVLSHETLETGIQLNRHRVRNMNLEPLNLVCTRRTESYGMSSTNLRRLRNQKEAEAKAGNTMPS